MSGGKPTWNEIKGFFNLGDIACMSKVFDLGSYSSVKKYILASDSNKNKILDYLRTGHMPEGGPQWDDDQFNRFKAWVDARCPK